MSIKIEQVQSDQDLDAFIKFAWEVYKGNDLWVPPILQDTKSFLAGKSQFFKHCQHRLFVAKESGKTVATTAAFYDQNLVKHWDNPIGMLGYFEALEDKPEAVEVLLNEAETYLRSCGATSAWAPVNGGIANPAGMLANAYNKSPYCLMTYNPSYYHHYFRRVGYQVNRELLAFTSDLMNGCLRRKVRYVLKKGQNSEITIRRFDRRRFKEDAYNVARIYSTTFKSHWGYAPASEEEVFEILEAMKVAIDPDMIVFAEDQGKTVGFALTVPDFNPLIKKFDGNLHLLNGFQFIRLKKKLKEARLIAIGVDESWRGKNVAPLIVASVYQTLIDKGYTTCEYSWVFKENRSSQNVAKKFKGEEYKNYYVYGKKLTDAA